MTSNQFDQFEVYEKVTLFHSIFQVPRSIRYHHQYAGDEKQLDYSFLCEPSKLTQEQSL